MTDKLLEQEITGRGPVEVTIAGKVCRLTFPMGAVIRYKQQTGDSLFQKAAWTRIDLTQDPERWTKLLWCGMHEERSDGTWASPLTLAELEKELTFSNAIALRPSLLEAIAAWLPKADPSPNGQADPEIGAPEADQEKSLMLPTSSSESGSAAAAD